jgi:2-polyprenyl-3-methyl-5-hydroxy-6-metoxy-1,4-benzoquinol methylase
MAPEIEKWNHLSALFDTHCNEDEIDPLAADNVIIAWPVLVNQVESYAASKPNEEMALLDYGCGTGGFCIKLASLGYTVIGIDCANELIELARKNSPPAIAYYVGDILTDRLILEGLAKLDVITSINVFQFIEDINAVAESLYHALKPGGMLVFAVFNPEFVVRCVTEQKMVYELVSSTEGTTAYVDIQDVTFKIWVRDECEYKQIFGDVGFTFLSTDYPPFTPEFVRKYNWPLPSDVSEYLIMAFRK